MQKLAAVGFVLGVLSFAGWQEAAFAEPKHTGHHDMRGSHAGPDTGKPIKKGQAHNRVESGPVEPGQGGFAAIAEIVALLSNDPATDWGKVDISALRRHLVDMNELTLHATSKTEVFKDKIVFHVRGDGRTLQAIHTMVPAHAGMLAHSTPWQTDVVKTKSGAVLTIRSKKPGELIKLKALGFFGVMATGNHHQAHHLAMAKGDRHIHAH